ncbi:cobalamin trafficking protein CblD [Cataglyphis hispanica]|uniref:cobalamin trafficking protein CblD n=1 Tax=Cataglyphis hispanica TaxID=1086592 RepID=UPI00217FF114|nr:cobalamin trafficking protein CblD [Cataglyphis hispanica]
MFCTRNGRKRGISLLFNLIPRVLYSRRNDGSTSISLHKLIKINGDSLDGDIDNSAWDTNSNWKLLTPKGFRFYLPGSVGPAWLDATTTAQVDTYCDESFNEEEFIESLENRYQKNKENWKIMQPMLDFVAQECPVLLRKSIEELFPECLDVTSSQLTIITINQRANLISMRHRKEAEIETCQISWNICTKLKMAGYWADFINPFSGQPHLSSRKSVNLYETDERFRCTGFKINQRNNCKIITFDNSLQNFIGNLYTTAPPSTEVLEQIINNEE